MDGSSALIGLVPALVTPILTAALGIVALVIGDWRQRRSEAGRRKLALEDASRQVAFATEWWNATKSLNDSPQAQQQATARAIAWLDEACAQVSQSNRPAEVKPAITLRRLLLAYPLRTRGARILRSLYYVALGCLTIYVGTGLSAALGRRDTLGIPNYFENQFVADLVITTATMLIAIGLRSWAVRAENAGAMRQEQGRPPLRRALLLYRFHRPVATLARLIFLAWALVVISTVIAVVTDLFDDPRLVPGDLVMLLGFTGWGVALRYWVVSLEERRPSAIATGPSAASAVPRTRADAASPA